MFIGEYKINDKETMVSGDMVNIVFKHDHPPIAIKRDLFNLITTEKKDRGNVTDKINHILSVKILMDLSDYGLEYYMVSGIATAMQTLSHNLREELFRKTFKCTGGDAIPLNLLLNEKDGKETK